MKGRSKKSSREKDLTSRYKSGGLDEDLVDRVQRFSDRAKHHQQNKTMRTAQMRAEIQTDPADLQRLPIGRVIQVYSRFCNVEFEGKIWLCVVRKTLNKVMAGDIVVGDVVRFRDTGMTDESGKPQGVLEQILPRTTVLTRADSFKQNTSHPIVANAEQMLIVASVHEPDVKWGLLDRMIIAAHGGGLVPILCLNKIDLAEAGDEQDAAIQTLRYYQSLGITTIESSVIENRGIDAVAATLKDRTTVLAGHSGVGKSSLIRAIQPDLDLRVGEISGYTGKGRHTTTSAREYTLAIGGRVIDTPGVKLFGLWNVTRENLPEFFPDVQADTAPPWRRESYERIEASL
ncbi:MAG TPA: ribosome small subunit-dependent GTPase A [Tepidisphaeraceae bacterium]|nr:ribosome small subunit-dependent GTPase A [Tepidisphaeraceae bacterium]